MAEELLGHRQGHFKATLGVAHCPAQPGQEAKVSMHTVLVM
jgi:hypothetical protein